MIGASMDFQRMSRKELQALCKSSGIPANKSNVFMMEALAKKRAPLSQVDSNREKGIDPVRKPPPPSQVDSSREKGIDPVRKPPPPSQVDSNRENGIDPVRKPPLYTNNFLRRGKRKEGDKDGAAGAALLKKVPKVESCFKSETLSASIGAKEPKVVTAGGTSSNGSANSGKVQIEDRIRSQINAALCSKVMKPPERRPSPPTSVGSPERVLESNVTLDNSEALDFPLENPEQQKELVQAKVESSEVLALPRQRQEQIEGLSFPAPLARQITKRKEDVTGYAALDVIASPPLHSSPFVRQMEERVHSIVDRIQGFWKSRHLTIGSSCSPVESARNVTECVIFSTPSFIPHTDT